MSLQTELDSDDIPEYLLSPSTIKTEETLDLDPVFLSGERLSQYQKQVLLCPYEIVSKYLE